MRNTRKFGQILRSKKRHRPTLRTGRGNRTNSNTSHQILAPVIEADSARAAGRSSGRGPSGGAALHHRGINLRQATVNSHLNHLNVAIALGESVAGEERGP